MKFILYSRWWMLKQISINLFRSWEKMNRPRRDCFKMIGALITLGYWKALHRMWGLNDMKLPECTTQLNCKAFQTAFREKSPKCKCTRIPLCNRKLDDNPTAVENHHESGVSVFDCTLWALAHNINVVCLMHIEFAQYLYVKKITWFSFLKVNTDIKVNKYNPIVTLSKSLTP